MRRYYYVSYSLRRSVLKYVYSWTVLDSDPVDFIVEKDVEEKGKYPGIGRATLLCVRSITAEQFNAYSQQAPPHKNSPMS